MDSLKMIRQLFIAVALCLSFVCCSHPQNDGVLLHREFYQSVWERFDYVKSSVTIDEPTTFDLNLRLCFTNDYPYENISLVFTVFSADNTPYRSKGYKFRVKDPEGNWNSELVNGNYTFELPINKALQLTEAGTYQFQIEQKMPVTPLVGVKELTLYNNKD